MGDTDWGAVAAVRTQHRAGSSILVGRLFHFVATPNSIRASDLTHAIVGAVPGKVEFGFRFGTARKQELRAVERSSEKLKCSNPSRRRGIAGQWLGDSQSGFGQFIDSPGWMPQAGTNRNVGDRFALPPERPIKEYAT